MTGEDGKDKSKSIRVGTTVNNMVDSNQVKRELDSTFKKTMVASVIFIISVVQFLLMLFLLSEDKSRFPNPQLAIMLSFGVCFLGIVMMSMFIAYRIKKAFVQVTSASVITSAAANSDAEPTPELPSTSRNTFEGNGDTSDPLFKTGALGDRDAIPAILDGNYQEPVAETDAPTQLDASTEKHSVRIDKLYSKKMVFIGGMLAFVFMVSVLIALSVATLYYQDIIDISPLGEEGLGAILSVCGVLLLLSIPLAFYFRKVLKLNKIDFSNVSSEENKVLSLRRKINAHSIAIVVFALSFVVSVAQFVIVLRMKSSEMFSSYITQRVALDSFIALTVGVLLGITSIIMFVRSKYMKYHHEELKSLGSARLLSIEAYLSAGMVLDAFRYNELVESVYNEVFDGSEIKGTSRITLNLKQRYTLGMMCLSLIGLISPGLFVLGEYLFSTSDGFKSTMNSSAVVGILIMFSVLSLCALIFLSAGIKNVLNLYATRMKIALSEEMERTVAIHPDDNQKILSLNSLFADADSAEQGILQDAEVQRIVQKHATSEVLWICRVLALLMLSGSLLPLALEFVPGVNLQLKPWVVLICMVLCLCGVIWFTVMSSRNYAEQTFAKLKKSSSITHKSRILAFGKAYLLPTVLVTVALFMILSGMFTLLFRFEGDDLGLSFGAECTAIAGLSIGIVMLVSVVMVKIVTRHQAELKLISEGHYAYDRAFEYEIVSSPVKLTREKSAFKRKVIFLSVSLAMKIIGVIGLLLGRFVADNQPIEMSQGLFIGVLAFHAVLIAITIPNLIMTVLGYKYTPYKYKLSGSHILPPILDADVREHKDDVVTMTLGLRYKRKVGVVVGMILSVLLILQSGFVLESRDILGVGVSDMDKVTSIGFAVVGLILFTLTSVYVTWTMRAFSKARSKGFTISQIQSEQVDRNFIRVPSESLVSYIPVASQIKYHEVHGDAVPKKPVRASAMVTASDNKFQILVFAGLIIFTVALSAGLFLMQYGQEHDIKALDVLGLVLLCGSIVVPMLGGLCVLLYRSIKGTHHTRTDSDEQYLQKALYAMHPSSGFKNGKSDGLVASVVDVWPLSHVSLTQKFKPIVQEKNVQFISSIVRELSALDLDQLEIVNAVYSKELQGTCEVLAIEIGNRQIHNQLFGTNSIKSRCVSYLLEKFICSIDVHVSSWVDGVMMNMDSQNKSMSYANSCALKEVYSLMFKKLILSSEMRAILVDEYLRLIQEAEGRNPNFLDDICRSIAGVTQLESLIDEYYGQGNLLESVLSSGLTGQSSDEMKVMDTMLNKLFFEVSAKSIAEESVGNTCPKAPVANAEEPEAEEKGEEVAKEREGQGLHKVLRKVALMVAGKTGNTQRRRKQGSTPQVSQQELVVDEKFMTNLALLESALMTDGAGAGVGSVSGSDEFLPLSSSESDDSGNVKKRTGKIVPVCVADSLCAKTSWFMDGLLHESMPHETEHKIDLEGVQATETAYKVIMKACQLLLKTDSFKDSKVSAENLWEFILKHDTAGRYVKRVVCMYCEDSNQAGKTIEKITGDKSGHMLVHCYVCDTKALTQALRDCEASLRLNDSQANDPVVVCASGYETPALLQNHLESERGTKAQPMTKCTEEFIKHMVMRLHQFSALTLSKIFGGEAVSISGILYVCNTKQDMQKLIYNMMIDYFGSEKNLDTWAQRITKSITKVLNEPEFVNSNKLLASVIYTKAKDGGYLEDVMDRFLTTVSSDLKQVLMAIDTEVKEQRTQKRREQMRAKTSSHETFYNELDDADQSTNYTDLDLSHNRPFSSTLDVLITQFFEYLEFDLKTLTPELKGTYSLSEEDVENLLTFTKIQREITLGVDLMFTMRRGLTSSVEDYAINSFAQYAYNYFKNLCNDKATEENSSERKENLSNVLKLPSDFDFESLQSTLFAPEMLYLAAVRYPHDNFNEQSLLNCLKQYTISGNTARELSTFKALVHSYLGLDNSLSFQSDEGLSALVHSPCFSMLRYSFEEFVHDEFSMLCQTSELYRRYGLNLQHMLSEKQFVNYIFYECIGENKGEKLVEFLNAMNSSYVPEPGKANRQWKFPHVLGMFEQFVASRANFTRSMLSTDLSEHEQRIWLNTDEKQQKYKNDSRNKAGALAVVSALREISGKYESNILRLHGMLSDPNSKCPIHRVLPACVFNTKLSDDEVLAQLCCDHDDNFIGGNISQITDLQGTNGVTDNYSARIKALLRLILQDYNAVIEHYGVRNAQDLVTHVLKEFDSEQMDWSISVDYEEQIIDYLQVECATLIKRSKSGQKHYTKSEFLKLVNDFHESYLLESTQLMHGKRLYNIFGFRDDGDLVVNRELLREEFEKFLDLSRRRGKVTSNEIFENEADNALNAALVVWQHEAEVVRRDAEKLAHKFYHSYLKGTAGKVFNVFSIHQGEVMIYKAGFKEEFNKFLALLENQNAVTVAEMSESFRDEVLDLAVEMLKNDKSVTNSPKAKRGMILFAPSAADDVPTSTVSTSEPVSVEADSDLTPIHLTSMRDTKSMFKRAMDTYITITKQTIPAENINKMFLMSTCFMALCPLDIWVNASDDNTLNSALSSQLDNFYDFCCQESGSFFDDAFEFNEEDNMFYIKDLDAVLSRITQYIREAELSVSQLNVDQWASQARVNRSFTRMVTLLQQVKILSPGVRISDRPCQHYRDVIANYVRDAVEKWNVSTVCGSGLDGMYHIPPMRFEAVLVSMQSWIENEKDSWKIPDKFIVSRNSPHFVDKDAVFQKAMDTMESALMMHGMKNALKLYVENNTKISLWFRLLLPDTATDAKESELLNSLCTQLIRKRQLSAFSFDLNSGECVCDMLNTQLEQLLIDELQSRPVTNSVVSFQLLRALISEKTNLTNLPADVLALIPSNMNECIDESTDKKNTISDILGLAASDIAEVLKDPAISRKAHVFVMNHQISGKRYNTDAEKAEVLSFLDTVASKASQKLLVHRFNLIEGRYKQDLSDTLEKMLPSWEKVKAHEFSIKRDSKAESCVTMNDLTKLTISFAQNKTQYNYFKKWLKSVLWKDYESLSLDEKKNFCREFFYKRDFMIQEQCTEFFVLSEKLEGYINNHVQLRFSHLLPQIQQTETETPFHKIDMIPMTWSETDRAKSWDMCGFKPHFQDMNALTDQILSSAFSPSHPLKGTDALRKLRELCQIYERNLTHQDILSYVNSHAPKQSRYHGQIDWECRFNDDGTLNTDGITQTVNDTLVDVVSAVVVDMHENLFKVYGELEQEISSLAFMSACKNLTGDLYDNWLDQAQNDDAFILMLIESEVSYLDKEFKLNASDSERFQRVGHFLGTLFTQSDDDKYREVILKPLKSDLNECPKQIFGIVVNVAKIFHQGLKNTSKERNLWPSRSIIAIAKLFNIDPTSLKDDSTFEDKCKFFRELTMKIQTIKESLKSDKSQKQTEQQVASPTVTLPNFNLLQNQKDALVDSLKEAIYYQPSSMILRLNSPNGELPDVNEVEVRLPKLLISLMLSERQESNQLTTEDAEKSFEYKFNVEYWNMLCHSMALRLCNTKTKKLFPDWELNPDALEKKIKFDPVSYAEYEKILANAKNIFTKAIANIERKQVAAGHLVDSLKTPGVMVKQLTDKFMQLQKQAVILCSNVLLKDRTMNRTVQSEPVLLRPHKQIEDMICHQLQAVDSAPLAEDQKCYFETMWNTIKQSEKCIQNINHTMKLSCENLRINIPFEDLVLITGNEMDSQNIKRLRHILVIMFVGQCDEAGELTQIINALEHGTDISETLQQIYQPFDNLFKEPAIASETDTEIQPSSSLEAITLQSVMVKKKSTDGSEFIESSRL